MARLVGYDMFYGAFVRLVPLFTHDHAGGRRHAYRRRRAARLMDREGSYHVEASITLLTYPTSAPNSAALSLTSYTLLALHGYPLTQRGAHRESPSSTSGRAADAEACGGVHVMGVTVRKY